MGWLSAGGAKRQTSRSMTLTLDGCGVLPAARILMIAKAFCQQCGSPV